MSANGGDDRLQFIAALAIDAHLVALDLRGDLEFAIANEAGDLFGHLAGDALFELDFFPRVPERRDIRVGGLHALETDSAFGEFADHDFVEGADLEMILGAQLDLAFLQDDFRLAALEIEA